MNFLILLLLALDLRVFAFNLKKFGGQNSNEVKVIEYNEMGQGECPKIKEPLCATNGEEFVHFENKCLLGVRNFELLLQGQQEFFECSPNLCNKQCPPCVPVYNPVCAVEQLTRQKESFQNPYEVQRRICNTQKDWQIVQPGNCADIIENKAVSPLNLQTQNSECPNLCTLEYKPICARFMTLEKEFSNECELKTTICQTKQKWDIMRYGPCEKSNANKALELTTQKNNCPKFCTLEYNPLCARFGNDLREFANKCELETVKCNTQQEWQITENGPCSSLQNNFENKVFALSRNPKCPQVCTLEYRPICAKFQNKLREFANKCLLESIICETEEEWQIVNNGRCSLNIEAFTSPVNSKCPEFCTLEYRPVCAKFNNEIREFSNNCALQRTICETNENWEVVHQGSCNSQQSFKKSKCPQICTLEYRPICAKFNNELREFPNHCTLERTICETKENWEIVLQGKCISDKIIKKPKCPQVCPLVFKPLCAKFNNNLRVFSNNCDLQRTICETNQKWQIVKEGSCFTDSVVADSECPLFCTNEYSPVCAEFNEKQREFPNNCELLRAICETNTKWEVVKLGPCTSNPPNLLRISEPCPKYCTREYNPVCAKSGNEFQEFSNNCVLQKTNCDSDKKWEFVKMGSCPLSSPTLLSKQAICPEFCTREYSPVCAKFDNEVREFPNKCELLRLNCETHKDWEIVKIGKCPLETVCPKSCTREYIPVCARLEDELREFPNKCEFQKKNCLSKKKWEIVNLGTCPSNSYTLQAPECPKFCTLEYNPVCAQFESELREFPNKCVFLTTNCESDKKWEIVNLGTCHSYARAFQVSGDDCPKFCTREYIPLCAQLEDELREFPNKCEFQRINCESEKKWEIVHFGTCPFTTRSFQAPVAYCPKFCTREYNPVCAQFETELREFPNKCEFLRTNCETNEAWKIVNLGKCTSSSPSSCPQFCTEEYRPVCAKFEGALKEFGNKCDLQRTICQTNTDWKLVNEGPCSSITQLKTLCPQFCTKEFNPVCVRFNGELREFPNHCEFQRSICETDIDWEFINRGPCLIDLHPICATNGKINKIFNDLLELQEEIKKTGKDWSLLHIANCDSQKTTTTTTTTRTTAKPKYLTTSKTTSKPKYTTSTFKTSSKPNYFTTPKTTTTTKTTPKTTTIKYPKYNPTSSTTVSAAPQDTFSYSSEANSEEMDNSSKGYYKENVSHCGSESYEDSDENIDDESYSWEDEEEEEEDGQEKSEEEEEDKVEGTSHPDKIDDSYSHKHNNTNSTYTTMTSEGYSKEINNSEKTPEEQYYSNGERDGKKEYKGKQETNSNFNKNLEHIKKRKLNQSLILSNKKSFQGRVQNNQKEVSSKLYLEDLKQNVQTNEEMKDNELSTLNKKTIQPKEGKKLIKLNQEEIWKSFGSQEQDSNNDRKFNSQQQHEINFIYSEENKENSQDNKENYENLLESSPTKDESLEANISYEENKKQAPIYEPSSQQVTHNIEAVSPYKNEPRFGVYSEDAYDLINSRKNQPKLSQYNNNSNDLSSNNEMDSYDSANNYQDNLDPKDNHAIPHCSNQTQSNIANNSENVLQAFETLLSKSDAKEEDDETLVKQVLTILDSETTTSYPAYEKTESQLNYTKREQHPSKYNSTNNKKGEVYNGVVYKAPVYDAPTYNFIYTTPNHPIFPLISKSNPFLNHPTNMPNPAKLAANPLLPLVNQTNSFTPMESIPAANLPFNPMQFLSLAAMSNQFLAEKSKLMPVPSVMEYGNNIPAKQSEKELRNNPLILGSTQSNLPLHPFAAQNFNHILPQIHASKQMFPLPQPEPFISHLAPFNNMNSQMPNLLPITHNKVEYEQNPQPKENQKIVPEINNQHPFPVPLSHVYQQLINAQQQQAQLLPSTFKANVSPELVSQPSALPYLQSSETAFNATIFNQILNTLKTIINRS